MQFFCNLIKQHVKTSDALVFLYRELAKLSYLLTPEHIAEVVGLVNQFVAGTPVAAKVTVAEAGVTTFANVVQEVKQVVETVVSQNEPTVSQTSADDSQPAAADSQTVVNADPVPPPAAEQAPAPQKRWSPKKS